MKKKFFKVISMLLVIACILSSASFAVTDSSEYIASTSANVTKSGNTVTVSFFVSGRDVMNVIGVSYIYLFENSGNGWKLVKSFLSSDSAYTSDLLSYNADFKNDSVSYVGSASNSYYAYVSFYAADNTGSDTIGRTTPTV